MSDLQSSGGARPAAPLETIRQEAEQQHADSCGGDYHRFPGCLREIDKLEAFARRWYQRGQEDATTLKQALSDFHAKLEASQVELPPEIAKVLRENLWNLYE